MMSIPPREYTMAIERQKTHRFNENEIRSFVYHVFSLYDKRVNEKRFLPFLAKDVKMDFPGKSVFSHDGFKVWYKNILKDYESNLHLLQRIDVRFLDNRQYEVDLMVVWQCQPRQGDFQERQFHQIWMLDENSLNTRPRILRYSVEEVPTREIWGNYVDYLKRKCIDEWCALWSDTGQFIVQYGDNLTEKEEEYKGGLALRKFMFGKIGQIKDIGFENCDIRQTTDPNVFFVSFDFQAVTTSGHDYRNRILVQVTLEGGKIKKLIEYADPRPRGRFIEALN